MQTKKTHIVFKMIFKNMHLELSLVYLCLSIELLCLECLQKFKGL